MQPTTVNFERLPSGAIESVGACGGHRLATHPNHRRKLCELPPQQVCLPRRGPEPRRDRDQPIRIAAVAPRVQAFGEQVEGGEDAPDAGEHPAVGLCSYQETVKLCLK